jgi:hypothetical protein
MNRWSFLAALVIVAGGLGAFAIYTFGYRDTGSSGLSRAEKERVASILYFTVAGNSHYYIEDIKRTSPAHYLVRYRNIDHPSVRICILDHVDLAKRRRVSKVQTPCD